MLAFRRLRTKLTVLYAGLFAVGLLLVSAEVYSAISDNAQRVVRGELAASGTVFDRVWALRTAQLENGAGLLSRDFGFRSAIATHDAATISSALENLRVRLGADTAFVIGADGASLAGGDGAAFASLTPAALAGVEGDDAASGVFVMGGAPYQAISVPVMAPLPMGWVVFASRLDRSQTNALEKLSAIPLDASVLARTPGGGWGDAGHHRDAQAQAVISRFVDAALKAGRTSPDKLDTAAGDSIALVKPLHSFDPGMPVILMLRYPLARALAPYHTLLDALAAIGLAGMALLVAGSWALARGVTRPLSDLEQAAHRLQRGEAANVSVVVRDEIGRLAESFNSMAAEIGERERRITHMALHDSDTDLPNRQALARDIAALAERAPPERLYVAALGVDRLTHVRGAIGHALFGELMAELGARLARLAPEARPARLATAILGLAFEAPSLTEAMARAEALREALEEPLRLTDNVVDVSLTLGLAPYAEGADRVASAIDRANIAVDQARAAKRPAMVFDVAVYGDPAANLSLMSEMRASIEAGHMALYHQPKFDLRQRRVTATEALVRWIHPTRGFLPPDRFIGMAEETGHIRGLTEWVLAQAVRDQKAMAAAGHDLGVSVNVSGRLLGDLAFADAALALVKGACGEICFEITETAVVENPDVALAVIDRFAAAGVAISIDDYGTGLSSLAYLKQIRANELKIDKSFVFAMGESQRDALLVRSTIDLAHGLGLKVTAEGIETETALALLTGMGCDLAQGYLIAKPMPLNGLLNFLGEDAPVLKSRA